MIPQIVVGLLVDRGGFPLEIGCFEGNKAKTATMIPIIKQFQVRHGLADMVVVADAGMPAWPTWSSSPTPACFQPAICASWTRRTCGSLSVPG
ncbi:hypothetical protein [Arthrobacter sp. NA-172]|uniref:hypothetical protein n=1 Tax=Arthrobacter sp. NA-172 TaxID=3367524 RepID=UPI0037551E16